MVRRWRADLPKAAAIDGRMGRNSIQRKSNSNEMRQRDFFADVRRMAEALRCLPEHCSHGSAMASAPPQR